MHGAFQFLVDYFLVIRMKKYVEYISYSLDFVVSRIRIYFFDFPFHLIDHDGRILTKDPGGKGIVRASSRNLHIYLLENKEEWWGGSSPT